MHRKMLNKQAKVRLYDNVNTNTSSSTNPEIYFLINPSDAKTVPMDMTVIIYLEQSLGYMRDLIDTTRNKEPVLC